MKLRVFVPILAAAAALIAGGCGSKCASESTDKQMEPSTSATATTAERKIIHDSVLEKAGVQPHRAMWWRRLKD